MSPCEEVSGPGEVGLGGPAELDLTIVLPYLDPGESLRPTVEETLEVLRATSLSFELILVSDGSTDGSEESVAGLGAPEIRDVRLERHRGKGAAVRTGLCAGRGAYLGFIDADGDVPPRHLAELALVAAQRGPDVIIGSKRHPDSDVVYPIARRLYSFGFQLMVRALFSLSVRDTQVGLKLFRRDVLAEILPCMHETGFVFDLEMLALAARLGHRDVVEAPVHIGIRFRSTISVRAVGGMLRDTLRLWWRLRRGPSRPL